MSYRSNMEDLVASSVEVADSNQLNNLCLTLLYGSCKERGGNAINIAKCCKYCRNVVDSLRR